MFPAGAAAALHPVKGAVLQRRLQFQTSMNMLNKFFVTIPEIFGSPLVYIHSMMLMHTKRYMHIIIIITIIIIIYMASVTQREIFRIQL